MAETNEEPKELVVIKFSGNYADEFDVEGLTVVTKEWWLQHRKDARDKWRGKARERYFGTNEFLEFYNPADYLRGFSVPELSQDEIQVIQKVVGKYGLGIVPFIEFED